MHGILQVRQVEVLFKHRLFELITPDRQTGLKAEGKIVRSWDLQAKIRTLFATQLHPIAIGQSDLFSQMVEQHHPSERRGQRRDEQTMIAPRCDAGERPRRVAAEPVRDKPLTPYE